MRIKKEYPDSILFFRLGDFYEMFFEDASIASKILGIALTSRNKSEKNSVPLCGVPYHSVEPYLAKLLEHGHKVAICEQVEDPRVANGIVDRKVVKVLTPGVILDTEKLDSKCNNFLAAIYFDGKFYGLAYADISTGQFKTTSFSTLDDLTSELSNLDPREIIVPENLNQGEELSSFFLRTRNPLISTVDSWVWELDRAVEILKEQISTVTLEPFGLDNHPASTIACAAVVQYLKETQVEGMPPLDAPHYYEAADYLLIDEATKRNLELTRTIRGESKAGSLVWLLDETSTAMGGRLLKQWINYPLIDPEKIRERLDAVEELKDKPGLRRKLRAALDKISDIERSIARISTSSAKPRDLGALRDSSYFISDTKGLLKDFGINLLLGIKMELDDLGDVRELLERALVDEPPLSSRDGGIVRDGFNQELDELRLIKRDGKKWIAELEAREKEVTRINSLKVGYNRVFGYYIEVTKPNFNLVPETYIRKQTLVNAERFITPQLKEYEDKILGAEDRILEIERELFEEIRKRVTKESERVRRTASLIAELDVLSSLAETADKYNYTKPQVGDSGEIDILGSRHPVVERI
ncbi:MAG: DNA mismatch repair protein MutS, partial [Thermodesulfobacteriota bacterium]